MCHDLEHMLIWCLVGKRHQYLNPSPTDWGLTGPGGYFFYNRNPTTPRICPGGHEISTNSIIYNILGPFNHIGKNDTVRRFFKKVPLRLPTRASQDRHILMLWCVKSMTIRNVFHLSLI